MVRKILKFILKEIKDAFSLRTWFLFYIPAMLIGMALFVHDRILFPPPEPTIIYTPPKVEIIQKWMDAQKKKFDNLKKNIKARIPKWPDRIP
ncbi:MAG: hypothetical protein C75L2_00640004 [Leptospirillum sp. Group II 'C75']|nr:MAG: hypothetical protein C75L2_00640004 [Leptospirillum sp. Group II 'C75']